MSRTGPSKVWLYGPIALFVVLAMAYTAYWFVARDKIEAGIDAWVEEQRALGVTVDYARKEIGGFPYRFALDVTAPVYRDTGAAIDWQGERLELVMQPWNFRHAIARAPGRNELNLAGLAGTALIDDKSALSLRWNDDGITDVGLTLNAADLITDTSDISLGQVRTLYSVSGRDARISADWERISVSPDLIEGQPFAFLGSSLQPGRLRLLMNGVAALPDAEPVTDRSANLAQLRLDWGALKLGAKGEFDITPAGHLDGSLKVRLDEADALSTVVTEAELGRPEIALIVQGVGAASEGGKFLSLPIRDGAVTFLGRRLTQLPPVAPLLAGTNALR